MLSNHEHHHSHDSEQTHKHICECACRCANDDDCANDDGRTHNNDSAHTGDHTYKRDHQHECTHQHEHPDDHGHTHDHDHDHNHNHGDLTFGVLDIQNHEGALVATIKDLSTGNFLTLENELSKWTANIAIGIDVAGGVIGHIKASLTSGNASTTFSTTDTSGVHILRSNATQRSNVAQTSPSNSLTTSELILVAIVFDVSAKKLHEIVAGSRPSSLG